MADQIIPFTRSIYQREDDAMSAAAAAEPDYEGLALQLIEQIDRCRGKAATPRLVGVAPGTIDNVRRGRLKTIGVRLFGRIRGAAIRELEKKIRSLEGDLALARQCGFGMADDEVIAATTAIENARAAVRRLAR